MKRIAFFIIILISFLGFSIINNRTITSSEYLNSNPVRLYSEVKNKSSDLQSDIQNRANIEIIKSFNLALTGYSRIDRSSMLTMRNYHKSLVNIFYKVMTGEERGDKSKPSYIIPSVYIKGSTGYILEKQRNGKNHLYTIEFIGTSWRIVDHQELLGNKI